MIICGEVVVWYMFSSCSHISSRNDPYSVPHCRQETRDRFFSSWTGELEEEVDMFMKLINIQPKAQVLDHRNQHLLIHDDVFSSQGFVGA